MDFIELSTTALALVEIVKRFIPKQFGKYVNPIIAISCGLAMAYINEGSAGLFKGFTAGAAAIGAYKIPKEIGKKIHTKDA